MSTTDDEPRQLSTGRHAGAGSVAGLVAGIVMTALMLLLASAFRIATPITIIGDRLSVFFNVETFLDLMHRLGGYNHMKQLGTGSVLLGQIVLGGVGGLIYGLYATRLSRGARRTFSICAFIILPLLAVAGVLWPVLGTSYSGYPIRNATILTLLGLAISFIAFERTLVLAFHGLIARPRALPQDVEFTPPIGRRALIVGGLGLLVAGGGAAILRKLYQTATFSYDGTQYGGETVQAITPNEQFYCVTKNVIDPVVDASVWRLEVTGLVKSRQTYKLDRLRGLKPVT
ncbi:MAG: hypothetical protein M3032_12495, partial [Verrucomicrobiota bacterium]|nr:hypothetical protein [Verrucomicrobiota bacterium]